MIAEGLMVVVVRNPEDVKRHHVIDPRMDRRLLTEEHNHGGQKHWRVAVRDLPAAGFTHGVTVAAGKF